MSTKTDVVLAGPQAGDLVGLKSVPIGVAQGRVFDIIGDVARIWWVDSGLDDEGIEGLVPIKVSDLQLLQRPAAYAAVRFTGTATEEPYAFVVADRRVESVRGAIHVFETADRYEVITHNVDDEPAKSGVDGAGDAG